VLGELRTLASAAR